MNRSPVRVLLAEDSGLMRLILSDILSQDERLELIDTAEDGKAAMEKVRALQPDVVLCDLVMPKYDGLYLVREIMKECPRPVVLLSSLDKGDPLAIQALMAGAVDFVGKPKMKAVSHIRTLQSHINEKVYQAARVDVSKIKPVTAGSNAARLLSAPLGKNYGIICIAASTGGPTAVESVLSQLPDNLSVPVVVVQHMPAMFLQSFKDRLQSQFPNKKIAIPANQQVLEAGIWIAPGTTNLSMSRNHQSGTVHFLYSPETYPEYNFPSANCLFHAAAKVFGRKAIGIILTGMGADGTTGLAHIYEQGGYTIAQDKDSSVVYGMPMAAFKAGAVRRVLPLQEIIPHTIGVLQNSSLSAMSQV